MRPFSSPATLALAAAVALVVAACDEDPAGLTNEEIAGSYAATTFTTTSDGTTTDQLSQGGSLTIQLAANGTTTGHVTVPASAGTGGEGLDADLAGTWTLSGAIVDLDHEADTFVRDMPFLVQGTTLIGDQTFQGTRVQAVLTRQ
jgi:hypothetical protein